MAQATLAKTLSQLCGFKHPNIRLEQYATDGETAAKLLHNAQQLDGFEGKTVLDLGMGTGILSAGASILGAKKIIGVEIDADAIALAKHNFEIVHTKNVTIIHGGIQTTRADIVVMNPPFGIQQKHADRPFLTAAMQSAPVIYSIHAPDSEGFIDALAKEYGYRRTHTWKHAMHLHNTHEHHKKSVRHLDILIIRLEKQ